MDTNAMDPIRGTCNFCLIADGHTDEDILERSPCGKFIVIVPKDHSHPDERLIIPVQHARDAIDDPELYSEAQRYAAKYLARHRNEAIVYEIYSDVTPPGEGGVLHLHVCIVPYVEGGQPILKMTVETLQR